MTSSIDTETLNVKLGARSYPIHIGNKLLSHAGELIKETFAPNRCFIISDENVSRHYMDEVATSLQNAGISGAFIELPAGESTKSFTQLESLLTTLLSYKPDRKTALIALGGGVIGDLTGFAASILLRGVPFVQIPTSLLAQVDSSVGGKTGINSEHGKNLIGSFYQPELVIIDTDTLHTLPERELNAGIAEVIKYGCINKPDFFDWLEKNVDKLMVRDTPALTHAIKTCCDAKAQIVSEDEKESGIRALLNLGHSFGHALEKLAGYNGLLLHGEAVAIGMVMAFDCSARHGQCNPRAVERVRTLLEKSLLPVAANHLNLQGKAASLIEAMRGDKKNSNDKLTLVLANAIGEAYLSQEIEYDDLKDLWNDYL